jgi:Na+/melibiose symporter-like transporter
MNYTIMTAVFALFYFVGIAILRSIAKPYDIVEDTPGFAAPKVSLGDMVKAVTTNSQLLILLTVNTLSMIGMMAMMNIMIYYWQLIVPYTHGVPMGTSFPGLYTLGSTITTLASFVFAMFGPILGTKVGKKNAIVIGMLGSTVSGVLNFFFGAGMWALYVAISMIGTFAAAMFAGFGINYALDCGEYGLWKTGQDHRLVIMSMTNMPMKIAAIIGGFILYVLAAVGFDSGAVMMSTMTGELPAFVNDDFVTAFMLCMCLVPAIFNLLGALLMRFAYKITDEDAAMYAKENMERMMAAGGFGGFGAPPAGPEEA